VYERSRQLGEKESWGPRDDEYDPWEVRSDVISPYSSKGDFETFVYFYGRFSFSCDLAPTKSDPHARRDFEQWMQLMKDLVRTPRDEWKRLKRKYPSRKLSLVSKSLPLHVQWRAGKAVGVIVVRTFLEAIVASIQIDKMHGVTSKNCAACFREFPLTTAHERFYCTKKCAHRIAVRHYRSRKEKQLRKSALLAQSKRRR
jgi:hypothetical protein